jgi:alkanesulfonate monooxygenase SsuD/methylene tetrahydromethanopterin reductase-like flavin-dependent oxidoreductase (luciferase family)
MRIGIGLPGTIPPAPGPLIADWARGAEERGFSSVATLDRIAYPNYDSLVTLAAAAAATDRIGLMTNILLAPAYNSVLLAKQAASIDRISSGRLTLGMSVGARPDDYEAAGQPFENRGRRFDEDLEKMHEVWGPDHPVGPKPHDGTRVRIMFGGTSDAAIRRTLQWGSGWTAGGSSAEMVAPFAERVRAAWREAGREGEPTIAALTYFGLGDDEASSRYIHDYYEFVGEYAEGIDQAVLRSPDAVRGGVARFEAAGVDELFLDATVADLAEVDLLADILF